ncbi:VOC family protein [Leptospira ellisii]|uniref:Lactoylglutathione lyase n=1 Tax=Leptospira ellisii TaxID=2023197 RepID=A0A2N0BC58_9LEPT|nr:VOC family protein [Leptospira ellisii]MDV6236099.1 VOC family protein [Leptospira ellisii]PJZ94095.1 lactoylglutathione lyase [Leptospira ellisii]PKA05148.1 lactoylglutathione lyase [Leptospira ellisii]
MRFKSLQKGIVTELISESKEFYTKVLGFRIKFESDWFVLLCLPDRPEFEIGFMLPGLEQVRRDYFRKGYEGSGVWIILESENIVEDYERMKTDAAPIDLPLTEEEWGDVHFTLVDPNGIGIDIVQAREV